MKYKVPLSTSNWAKYMDRKGWVKSLLLKKSLEYLPNKLTSLYFKIYYKEENYLKVKTAVFKYITPPIAKFGILVCQYA